MGIGGRGAERVKYQRQANCRSDPSARTAHKRRHSLVPGPQDEHESGPDQECDARRMATAKPQCTRPNWCQVSWGSLTDRVVTWGAWSWGRCQGITSLERKANRVQHMYGFVGRRHASSCRSRIVLAVSGMRVVRKPGHEMFRDA